MKHRYKTICDETNTIFKESTGKWSGLYGEMMILSLGQKIQNEQGMSYRVKEQKSHQRLDGTKRMQELT
jgi:hypothetical protein